MDILGSAAAESPLSIKTEEGDYLALSMTGHEHLGQMFEYTVEMALVEEESLTPFDKPKKPDLGKLIGTGATLSMKLVDDKTRYFHGYVTRAKRGERRGRYTMYTVTLRPGIWFMTQTKDSRVFQEKSVKDVVTEILKDYNVDADWQVKEYPKLDYCVQHNETDFDFLNRLLEEVGIYYFFEHDDGAHKIVLIDEMGKHKPHPNDQKMTWRTAMTADPSLTTWYVQQEVRSAKTVLTEYDFLAPTTKIEGTNEAKDKPEMLGKMEWFEHPARVVQNSVKDETQPAANVVKDRAEVRMQELLSLYSSATGTTNVRDLGAGMTFEIEVEPNKDDDGKYLMVAAIYRIDFGNHEALSEQTGDSNHEPYLCDFLCINKDAHYRSPRLTPRPVISGPQTAIVVGKSGNEIETDKHGRIKIQFHWDRLGKKDQNSSCWVRVAQPWAGKGFGMFSLPRVGHEVVVHFLDGDPDRPLVIGSVYNNDNMVAWKLPDQATVSGFKSQSTKEGTAALANELRFNDEKTKEYIWFQAQKDFHRLVEHDAFDWIGNNESVKVVLTRKEAIGENWFMDITKDVMHNVGKDLHVNVAGDIFHTGGATWQLKLKGDFNAKIGADLGLDVDGKTHLKTKGDIALHSTDGKISLKSGKDPMTGSDVLVEAANVKIKAGSNIVLEATGGITLKVGGSLVNIGPAGVDIVGPMVKINSGGGGGSAAAGIAASPTAPTEAKKEDLITSEKKTDYYKLFDDPMPDDMGGSGAAKEPAKGP